MRYFKVTDSNGWISIWETDDKKKKERIIYSNDKDVIDLEEMKKKWTPYTPPSNSNEKEEEISQSEAFGEML